MAKKRTKLQKQKALVRRKYQVTPVTEARKDDEAALAVQPGGRMSAVPTKSVEDHSSAIEKLIRTELPLLKGDLKRSVLTAAVMIACLIGIYLYLRYN